MNEARERKIDLSKFSPEEQKQITDKVKMQCVQFFTEAEQKSKELLNIYGITFDIIVAVRPEDVPAEMQVEKAPKQKKGRPKKTS